MHTKVICLTPVKNERWILNNFLKAASIWADHIILSDQMSSDNSREIVRKYPKVILIENSNQEDFDEYRIRNPLVEAARKIVGKKLLIALDADEVLTPNFKVEEWHHLKQLPEGTIIRFPIYNIGRNFEYYWKPNSNIPIGYIDDGAIYKSGLIHASRLFDPVASTKHVYDVKDIAMLHLQYIYWDRMMMKQRWYQCFEKIKFPHKSPIEIYRKYHHMYSLTNNDYKVLPSWWIKEYKRLGVDLLDTKDERPYHWEHTILNYMDKYEVNYFKKLAIWDVDWTLCARNFKRDNPNLYKDPRDFTDKIIHNWLQKTQPVIHLRRYRKTDELIKRVFNY